MKKFSKAKISSKAFKHNGCSVVMFFNGALDVWMGEEYKNSRRI